MDKYEYKLKLEQLKKLAEAKDYAGAAQIADGINWRKVKSVATLCMVGEIYEKTRQFELSKEILLMAYDRSPVGRSIIYRLTMVTIKLGNLKEAQEYYEEFIDIAPHDNMKYVLRYELSKAKGESLDVQISILEEFKEREYTEEWAFELAYLYHKSNQPEKCVDVCDELILWFGEGKYVEKALELKMIYQPLNKLQEDKYRRFQKKQEGEIEVRPEDGMATGEIVHDTIKIPDVKMDTVRFNTMNLQAEIAKSMQQIMEATEQETVTDTMDNIKKMVDEIPYFYMPVQEPEYEIEDEFAFYQEPAEEWEEFDDTPVVQEEAPVVQDYKSILAEDYDGQISLNVPPAPHLDLQITGQMSIEDILVEWEQRKLEQVKQRALQEAEDIMGRLVEVMPDISQQVTREIPTDAAVGEETPSQPELHEEEELQQEEPYEEEELPQPELYEEVEPQQPELYLKVEPPRAEQNPLRRAIEQQARAKEELERQLRQERGMALREEELPQTADVKPMAEQEPQQRSNTRAMSQTEQRAQSEQGQRQEPVSALTEEQKEIFSYFALISGMEGQICRALEGIRARKQGNDTSNTGNMIIFGGRGSGKTVLATDFIKAYQKLSAQKGGKIGKISASVLNQKDVDKLFAAVEGGYLIIEKAGDLSRDSVTNLTRRMEQPTGGLLVILEDDKAGIEKVLGRNLEFARKFTDKINIPVFSSDELVVFARAYALEQDCEIEDMGVLALYNSISNIQRLDDPTTLTEVKEIMDNAIYNAQHGGLKKLFGRKHYSENGRLIIREKDFEE